MSADTYEDCPNCGGIKTVRIDGVWDFTLNSGGTITSTIRGECNECLQKYK